MGFGIDEFGELGLDEFGASGQDELGGPGPIAGPAIVPCAEGEWTPVAINVSRGEIFLLSDQPGAYLYTYRDTGLSIPTEKDEGVEIFLKEVNVFKLWERVVTPSDIYIWAEDRAGKVRADVE